MVRMPPLWLPLIFLTCLPAASWSRAQEPAARPPAGTPAPDSPGEPEFLKTLPRPPGLPASLLQPAPPERPLPPPSPGPYFEHDVRLDPPDLSPPGWFGAADLNPMVPHVKNRLENTVTLGTNPPDFVHVASANLGWTVAPRVELGYRLPSGFGEFSLAYRFLASEGTGSGPGPDTTAALKSRLNLQTMDLDYCSREFSLWPCWDLKWRFGLRLAFLFFEDRTDQTPNAAAAGSGILEQRTSNWYWGVGPHVGVELARLLGDSGLALWGRIDGSVSLGRQRQTFTELSVNPGPAGGPAFGETLERRGQAVPQLLLEAGLRWNPPGWPHSCFFAGYQYEYWWDVGRNSETVASRGEFWDQGLLLRAEFNF
jgi:hypothetical protein